MSRLHPLVRGATLLVLALLLGALTVVVTTSPRPPTRSATS